LRYFIHATAAAAALAFAAPAVAQPAAPAIAALEADVMPDADCFQAADFQGWHSPEPGTVLLRIGDDGLYRMNVAGTHVLNHDGRFELRQIRGRTAVCGHRDVQVIAEADSGAISLTPVLITRLSSTEVAELPTEHRP